jgi:uncharacterized membrane protein
MSADSTLSRSSINRSGINRSGIQKRTLQSKLGISPREAAEDLPFSHPAKPAKLVSMPSLYNRVAGRSIERLAALSDGIFAVSMTLLVLDLRVPASEAVHSERDLWQALVLLSPRLVIFAMSVMTNGIFWVGQQTQLNHFARADRNLAWIHIAFLCCISLTPFTTSLLAEYIHYRTALLVYWFNIVLLGVMLYWSWSYAMRYQLIADDAPQDIHPAVVRRIVIAQSLYAAGAAMCVFNTCYSIAAIVLIQINYAIAPRFCWGLFSRKSEGERERATP